MNPSNLYTIFIKLLSNRLLLNSLFWLIYAIFPLCLNWDSFASAGDRNTDIAWYLQAISIVYINNLILMPLLFDQRDYVRYFFSVVVLVCSVEYLNMFGITPLISDYLDYVDNKLLMYLYDLGESFFMVLAFAGGRLIRQYISQQHHLEQLQQKQIETELAFLRSQVNPHLLFNTLNMIYAHALERSPKVPPMILSLSQNMRYLLYECNEAHVPLSKEVQFLRDYVELQKMRIEDRGRVNFEVFGNTTGLQLAPMLLIAFVENAFKHASENTIDGIEIDIRLQVQGTDLWFEVVNNYDEHLMDSTLRK
ncbi:MAG: sensor histidine kinase, partial [Bacteroidota bacterium]